MNGSNNVKMEKWSGINGTHLAATKRLTQALDSLEAAAKTDERCSLSERWRIEDSPPEDITWDNLQRLVGERGLGLWEEIKKL